MSGERSVSEHINCVSVWNSRRSVRGVVAALLEGKESFQPHYSCNLRTDIVGSRPVAEFLGWLGHPEGILERDSSTLCRGGTGLADRRLSAEKTGLKKLFTVKKKYLTLRMPCAIMPEVKEKTLTREVADGRAGDGAAAGLLRRYAD